MWCFLEHINILLNGVVRVISNLPEGQAVFVKLNNNAQLRKRAIEKVDDDNNKGYEKIVTSHLNIPYVTNANGELIPGVLVYIMEGVLPLIKVWILAI